MKLARIPQSGPVSRASGAMRGSAARHGQGHEALHETGASEARAGGIHAKGHGASDTISVSAFHKGGLPETYDSLLEFGFDVSELSENSITCSKDLSTSPGSHIMRYELDFSAGLISMSYVPVEGDRLAHAEAACLFLSILEACGNYSADSKSLAHAISVALGKSLQQ